MGPDAVRVSLSGAIAGVFEVTKGRPLTIGRAGRVRLYDLSASRLHCRIELRERGLTLVDLKSTNGTVLNGEQVTRQTLHDGDAILVGTSRIQIRLDSVDSRLASPCVECGASVTPEQVEHGGAVANGSGVFCEGCAGVDGEHAPADGDSLPASMSTVDAIEAGGFREVNPLILPGHRGLFNARRSSLGQPVTIKVLDAHFLDKDRVDRFLLEARLVARLSHSNVARVIDIGSSGHVVYTVLERFEGRTFLEEVQRAQRVQPRRALAVALPVARALAYMHGQLVVHGDVRPTNLLVTRDGHTKLMGFDRSRSLDGDGKDYVLPLPASRDTAPEIASGGDPTVATDIYGVGVLLFRALTGLSPRDAPQANALDRLAPELPPVLRDLVHRCLREDPAERFQEANALVRAIESAVRALYGFERGDNSAIGLLAGFGPGELTSDTTRRTRNELLDAFSGPGSDDADSSTFFGRFRGSELIELVQLVDLNCKTGTMIIRTPDGERATIAFRDGKAIHARFRELKGYDAVVRALCVERGQFRLIVEDPAVEPEHALALSPILLEIMRLLDESQQMRAFDGSGRVALK